PELNEVRKNLVTLALEVMLGGPQHVEAELVHELGNFARGEIRLAQPLVGISPLVGRGAAKTDIVELDLSDVEDMEFTDHAFPPAGFRPLSEVRERTPKPIQARHAGATTPATGGKSATGQGMGEEFTRLRPSSHRRTLPQPSCSGRCTDAIAGDAVD